MEVCAALSRDRARSGPTDPEVCRAKLRAAGVAPEVSTARLNGGAAEGAKGPLAGGVTENLTRVAKSVVLATGFPAWAPTRKYLLCQ